MPCFRGLSATFASVAAASLLVANVALAETSAADKAAARQVATEGIQLFKTQKYAEALDRLKRAQALYDAPVHLLYIARAEERLGLLVEASEHYRQLDHYTLPPNPPEAWSAAVDDGRKEFAAVEPRVPRLRVMTEPPVSNAALRIDGADVSSAAVGIPRPINAGRHRVDLATPGHEWLTAEVDVAEGTTRDVVFRVQPGEGAPPVVTAGVVENPPPGEPVTGAGGSPDKEGPFVGFLGSLRLGGAVPTGQVFAFPVGTETREVEVSSVAQPGGFLELEAGIRLGRYFTPLFFLSGQTLGHPSQYVLFPEVGQAGTLDVKSAEAASFGIGVRFGTPPGKIGAFGEFDIGLLDVMTVKLQGRGANATECKIEARGASIRFGGGAVIPIVKWLQITPLAMVSLGRYTSRDATGCGLGTGQRVTLSEDIPSEDQRTHGMIFLGVGGDVIIGGRR